MRRIETARLAGIAFHQPERLEREHQLAIADAAGSASQQDNESLRAYGEQLVRDLTWNGILDDGNPETPRQSEQSQ